MFPPRWENPGFLVSSRHIPACFLSVLHGSDQTAVQQISFTQDRSFVMFSAEQKPAPAIVATLRYQSRNRPSVWWTSEAK